MLDDGSINDVVCRNIAPLVKLKMRVLQHLQQSTCIIITVYVILTRRKLDSIRNLSCNENVDLTR